MKIIISSNVRVENQSGINQEKVARLINQFPQNAAAGDTFLRLGRNAVAAVVKEFDSYEIIDHRNGKKHNYSAIEENSFPQSKKYDIRKWLNSEGGFILLNAGCHHRAIPNIVRNIAMHSGQFVTVIMPEEKYIDQAEKLGFTDHAKYSNAGYLVAGDGDPPLPVVAGDSDPPRFSVDGDGDPPPSVLSVSSVSSVSGIIIAVNPSMSTLEEISRVTALKRYVITTPHSPHIENFRDSIGPVLYSNSTLAALEYFPYKTEFDNPVHTSTGKFILEDTIYQMVLNRERNDFISETISRTHLHRSLLLTEYISIANNLPTVIADYNLQIIPFQSTNFVDCDQQKMPIEKIKSQTDELMVISTYDDSSILENIPFDTIYLLTPAGAKRQILSIANIRKCLPGGKIRIIDFTDPPRELKNKTNIRQKMLIDRLNCKINTK